MAKIALTRTAARHLLLWGAALLLAALAIDLASPKSAFARVGITSAAEGDPLGKPPAEPEQVLRIGVDVQANEVVTTNTTDRAHLVFLDGTSVTVGPSARLVIDKFVYDPNTRTGDLAINLSQGVLRMVGGKISKTTPVVIKTPSADIAVRGGITLVEAGPTQTTATFIFGRDMTVAALGLTQFVTRPGTAVITQAGAPPSLPVLIKQGAITADIKRLEGRGGTAKGALANANSPAIVKGVATVAASGPQQEMPSRDRNAGKPGSYSTGSVSSTDSLGWQQWGAFVAYFNPVVLNAAVTNNVPLTGNATYNGTFNAVDQFNGPFSGTFFINWNFASHNGFLSATPNTTAQSPATANLTQNGNGFSGVLQVQDNAHSSGPIRGTFTTFNNIPLGGVQGSFSVTNPITGGGGSGTFSGHR